MKRSIIIAAALLLCSCTHLDRQKLTDWATEKASRWAQCQLQDPISQEQARACLGEFASDLGTDACGAVEEAISTLPHDS